IMEASTGQELQTLDFEATCLAFSPNGEALASGALASGVYRTYRRRNEKTGNVVIINKKTVTDVIVCNARTGQKRFKQTGLPNGVGELGYSRDGTRIASAGQDGLIKIWDAVDGREIKTLKGHNGAVTSVAFHPNGETLASTSADTTVKIWDTRTGEAKFT